MSKFVIDIINDLKTYPYNWVIVEKNVIRNDKVELTDEWPSVLTWYLPFIICKINGIEMNLTYKDRVKLAYAIKKWQRKISLNHLYLGNKYDE